MIMICDAMNRTTTPKAVPAWMYADNYSQLVQKKNTAKKRLFKSGK